MRVNELNLLKSPTNGSSMPRLIVATLLGLLGVVSPVLAQQPVIQSASVQNGQLTLGGNGFGGHGDFGGAAPFLSAAWNDFSTGINGGNWALDGTNNAAWSYQTSGGRTSGKRWARKDWIPSISDDFRRLGALALDMTGTTGEFRTIFYLRCGTNVDQAAKFWRIYGLQPNPGDGSSQQSIFLSITNSGRDLMAASNGPGNPPPTTVWAVATPPGPIQCSTRWQKFSIYMRDTAGDDYIEVEIDDQLAFRRGSQLPSLAKPVEGSVANERQQWVPSPWGGDGHTLDIGHMVDGDFFGYSDVFADYTRALLELSDVPSCATSRRREPQIPLQWSESRIVAQLNPGTFQTGQTVYACVTAANGSVSAVGMPVVIGGGVPPPQPTPLTVTCPANRSVQLSTGTSLAVTFPAPVAAGGAAPVTVSTQPVSGSTFSVGATTVTGTARDAAGQTASCSFTVTLLAVEVPPPTSDGCLDGTTRYAFGTGPAIERPLDGTADQRLVVAARIRALRKAGFLLDVSAKSTFTQILPTCNRP